MTDSTFHFVIPSTYAAVRDVQSQLMAAVEKHGYDHDATWAIKLSLEETLINAIKHGNKFDATKTVTIDATIGDKSCKFAIHDQGSGFERKDVPDPTREENLEKSSGRGLLLIETYMSEVAYSDNGRKCRMVFRKK